MICLRRSRGYGVGPLRLADLWLSPEAELPGDLDDGVEVVTYVVEGALAQRLPSGELGLVQAGEFQLRRGRCAGEANASGREGAHVVQVRLQRASDRPRVSLEQRRFCAAERRGLLRLIASPDGAKRSLRLEGDARLYSALLDPGQHVAHALAVAGTGFVHVVSGEVRLDDRLLTTGDSAGLADERVLSLTAQTSAELLVCDLGPRPS